MKGKRKLGLGVKILLGILIIIIVSGMSIGIWYYSTVNSINKELTPEETVMGSGEKQALVIYQPSNADAVSSPTVSAKITIADTLVDCGYAVTVNFPSEKLEYDLNAYDILVFGSPVYSGKLSTELKEYVESNTVTGKHILLFITGMYPEVDKELKDMETWINVNNSVEAIKISEDENNELALFVTQVLERWEDTK